MRFVNEPGDSGGGSKPREETAVRAPLLASILLGLHLVAQPLLAVLPHVGCILVFVGRGFSRDIRRSWKTGL